MDLLAAAVYETIIDFLYALLLLGAFVSLLTIGAILAYEFHQRIAPRLRARRCWKEIETARRDLVLDEHIARSRERVGIPKEHVAGYRRSA